MDVFLETEDAVFYVDHFQHDLYGVSMDFYLLTHEEKLTLLFDFYMWMTNGELEFGLKKNAYNYCPFTYMKDIDDCSWINKKTFCSKFEFISSKSKFQCPCEQHGPKNALEQLKKLLVHEGFIPTKAEIKKQGIQYGKHN